MYFGTWIDAEGEFFDTAHFADSLQKYPFRAEVAICYWEMSKWITTSPITKPKWQNAVHT
jgi:hypothetical protein